MRHKSQYVYRAVIQGLKILKNRHTVEKKNYNFEILHNKACTRCLSQNYGTFAVICATSKALQRRAE